MISTSTFSGSRDNIPSRDNTQAKPTRDMQTISASPTPTASPPDAEIVLRVMVEARGNHRLAQDILRTKYNTSIDTPEIVALIKDRLPELKAQMEVVATLELFSLMPQLHKTLVENLSNLEGGDAVNAYMKLMDLITKQTSSNELNININDQRFKQAPRDLQRVYAQLEAAGKLAEVVEGEYREVA